MEIKVYVEGPSDKYALQTLLGNLIAEKEQGGIAIKFFPARKGDSKVALLTKNIKVAADILIHIPNTIVVIYPDLYPLNKGLPHKTIAELEHAARKEFEKVLQSKKAKNIEGLTARFKVFCFKYDMESLVLACEEGLKRRLGVNRLKRTWKVPVEDQNNVKPPKKVVEDIFRQNNINSVSYTHLRAHET